jgi:hypothetical protein
MSDKRQLYTIKFAKELLLILHGQIDGMIKKPGCPLKKLKVPFLPPHIYIYIYGEANILNPYGS